MKILVVDDNYDNIELLCQILEDEYETIKAYNGSECIQLAKEQQPDMIILDVMMPEMDGYEVLRRLREDEDTSGIMVIFLTARCKDTDRMVRGLEEGALDYIIKPVNDEVLLAKVKAAARVKNYEDDMKKQKAELEKANEKLKELDILKTMFVTSMSHELRTPLNSIIGFSSILLQGMAGETNEEQSKQLTMIKNSALHLLSLINEILDISKIEAGKIQLRFETFDLSYLVEKAKKSFAVTLKEKDIHMVLEKPDKVPIESDKTRVEQILLNLVGNAVKYTKRGEIKISIVQNAEEVEVSVSDTGAGIRAQDMDKLFVPFGKLYTEGEEQEGTGLGLYLSKKLLTSLGGNIMVESEVGKGSVFTFTLPLR